MIEIGAGLLLAAVPASAVTFLFGVLLTTPVERALGKWRAWRCWRWASPAGWRAPTRRAGHAPARGAGDLVPRSGYTAQGRPESTAEHTWRLCLMVRLFEDTYPGIDHLHLLKLCVIYDLVRRCRATSLPSTDAIKSPSAPLV